MRLTSPPSRAVMKSGSLNLLETSGPHRACYGTHLPFLLIPYTSSKSGLDRSKIRGTLLEDQSSYTSKCAQPVQENGHTLGPMENIDDDSTECRTEVPI